MINNLILDLFYNFIPARECQHDKVSPMSDGEYCPDCGRYIVNEWYITRCKCCGVRLQSVKKGDKIVPAENFCHNCGGSDFYLEKLSKIDFININYAVLIKKAMEDGSFSRTTQCWQEPEDSKNNVVKLLPFLEKKNLF